MNSSYDSIYVTDEQGKTIGIS